MVLHCQQAPAALVRLPSFVERARDICTTHPTCSASNNVVDDVMRKFLSCVRDTKAEVVTVFC